MVTAAAVTPAEASTQPTSQPIPQGTPTPQPVTPGMVIAAANTGQPNITARHRQIWLGMTQGAVKDTTLFSVVGDCNSIPPVYLQRVVNGAFNVDKFIPALRATQNHFGKSFSRVSLAANGGFTSAAMNDPVWADGALCGTQRTPFECEILQGRASIVFIQVGTGDQYVWKSYEANLRRMLDTALKNSVLPVLFTKADNLETLQGGAPPDFINNVIRKLAREFDVPLVDFHAASRNLPNNGLIDEGDLDFHLSEAGMDLHLLLTLQTLARIRG